MNKKLDGAIFELGKADALMHSIECLYLDFDFLPEEKEKAERGAFVFYATWDAVKKAIDYIDEYCGECRVVDVLETVEKMRSKRTLKTQE